MKIQIQDSSKKGFSPVLVLVALVIVVAAVGGYYLISKNPGSSIISQLKKTPYQELQTALDKTSAATTAYLDYQLKATTRITNTKTGVTQSIDSNVDGYLTGSTDGENTRMEIRISSAANPSASIIVDVTTVGDKDIYLKGPATYGKWQKYSKEEFDAQNAETPTDASFFAFNILGTVFADDKSLFKATQKESVRKLQDQTIGGITISQYEAEVSVVDFVNAMRTNKDNTAKDISDAQAILKDATIKVTYSVDKSTGYVTKITEEAKNLLQISTPEAEKLGLSSQHDEVLTANLSRFNLPTDVTAPAASEIIKP